MRAGLGLVASDVVVTAHFHVFESGEVRRIFLEQKSLDVRFSPARATVARRPSLKTVRVYTIRVVVAWTGSGALHGLGG